MDLRSLIDKLDTIEQSKLLFESEDLLEKVGLRLDDYTNAVRGITNADERAAKIGEFARQYNYAGLFDPITGKFVNADGKFAFFGGYESEVKQLAARGLIPDAAKTTAVLGMMGQDEKVAKPTSQSAEALYKQIDKADELIKKALEVPTSEGISESLLKEFGINTNILEAINPEEHQLIKKTRKDIEPLLKSGDGDAVEYKGNYDNYIKERDRLIARIKEIIATIKKPATAPATAPAAERSGSSNSPKESLENNSELLLELSLTPQGKKAGAKLFEPDWKGYLSPQQVQANLALLKKGHAKLDWNDHVGKTVKDWANMATFNLADKAAAYASSIGDKNTSYEKERAKQQAADQAYNQDPNALNLRTAANAVGYKIDPTNDIGNMTIGDIMGLVGPSAVTAMFNAGTKVATKIPMLSNTVGKLVTGTAAVVGTQKAADQIGKVPDPAKPAPGPNKPVPGPTNNVQTQPAENLKYDPEVEKIQKHLEAAYGGVKNILPRFGVDGKLGKETIAAIERAKKEGKLTPDGKVPGATTTADATTATNASAALDPKLVQDELKKLGVSGNQITPEQLLALADTLGIKDGEQVADAGSTASTSATTSRSSAEPTMAVNTATPAPSSGGIVQGTTATAESLELNRILSLSGLNEDDNLEEGAFDKFLPWVFDQMIAKGMSREAQLAAKTPIRGMTRAEIAEIRAAKEIAKRVQSQGAPKAAGAVDDVAGAVAKTADDAAKVVPKVADDAVSKLTSQAAKGEGLLYNVGKLGGRFVRLVKNNKFLALLAALAALGIALYASNTDDNVDPGKVDPMPVDPNKVDPNKVDPNKVDPNAEENKRKLADLEKLLAQLYGGWPTDPETAETIKAGVDAGAKAPAGFKEGGVQTQPASGSNSSSGGGLWQGKEAGASAEELVRLRREKEKANAGASETTTGARVQLSADEKSKIDMAFANPTLAKSAVQAEYNKATPEKRAAVKAYLDSKGYDSKKTFGIDFSA